TGRADEEGIAITFATPKEAEYLAAIEALMNLKIAVAALPKELEISTELTPDEIPQAPVKNTQGKFDRKIPSGAFHEKKDKNKKVNAPVSRSKKQKLKYGKPKKRRPKEKGAS